MTVSTLDLTPARQDFRLVRGDTWKARFLFKNSSGTAIDLTGSTWLVQVRLATPDGTLFGTFTVSTASQATGIIDISLDESITAAADPKATYWYDVQQTLSGDVATPVHGKISVVADVSRSV
jgi:hypothetical protein